MARAADLERIYSIIISMQELSSGRGSRGGRGDSNDRRIAASLRTLSRGLTRDRALAGERYLSDPALLDAYLRHFWLISFAQASLCLSIVNRLRSGARSGGTSQGRALDLGAGPGPVSLALLEQGYSPVIACDRSKQALSVARSIARRFGYGLRTTVTDLETNGPVPTGPWDLITLGHLMNELWATRPDRFELIGGFARRLIDGLSPGGRMIIIEPALKSTAQDAIRIRDLLVERGMVVEHPCTRQDRCPALPDATCHGEFGWSPPKGFTRLAHAARIGRESLKMSYFILRKPEGSGARAAAGDPERVSQRPGSPEGLLHRVVSDTMVSKGARIRCLVCGPAGRFPLSAPLTSTEGGIIRGLKRGDAIRFTGTEERESGRGLVEGSRIEIVERASEDHESRRQ